MKSLSMGNVYAGVQVKEKVKKSGVTLLMEAWAVCLHVFY